jgi:hypothetical protein
MNHDRKKLRGCSEFDCDANDAIGSESGEIHTVCKILSWSSPLTHFVPLRSASSASYTRRHTELQTPVKIFITVMSREIGISFTNFHDPVW